MTIQQYEAILSDLKDYRRIFAELLIGQIDYDTVKKLGETHSAILAIEALMAESEPIKTGPNIEFGSDGWPL